MNTNIGTSSVTGGTTISATFVERKSRWPRKRPNAIAYAASRATRGGSAHAETVARQLVGHDRAQSAERRVGRKARRVELVGRIGLERGRNDEPERVERRQADDHEERVPRQEPDEAPARPSPHVASARPRTHRERPISTLAMPRSITATLAAVPLA